MVELALILPIFMFMIFFIMELGNLAYQTIIAHHAAYELARIGSLVAGPDGGSSRGAANIGRAQTKMTNALYEMFPGRKSMIVLDARVDTNQAYPDPQDRSGSHMNEDLMVTLSFPAKLVFPFSRYWLSSPRLGSGIRIIRVRVRMPIEKPFFQ